MRNVRSVGPIGRSRPDFASVGLSSARMGKAVVYGRATSPSIGRCATASLVYGARELLFGHRRYGNLTEIRTTYSLRFDLLKSLRDADSGPHCFEGGWLACPGFPGEGALVDQHAEAVNRIQAAG